MRPESGRIHNFRHNENPTLCPGVRPQLTFLFIVSLTNVGRIKLGYVNLKNSYDVT